MAAGVYRPELWRDFFVMVGGGAAVLTGLVFVAMTLNLDVIACDPTHRYRAIGTLAGFSAAFLVCAFALMGGQDQRAIGVEWFVVSVASGAIYVNGWVQAARGGGSRRLLSAGRVILGTFLHLAETVGALLLILGYVAGLYLAAVAMTALIALGISGAWLLLIGVEQEKAARLSGQ